MKYHEFITELKSLKSYAQELFNKTDTYNNSGFRSWRHKLDSIIESIKDEGYSINCGVKSRLFTNLSQSTSSRLQHFNMELQDTINELETIIENFDKFGEPKIKNMKEQPTKDNHISMKGIKIPIWLIVLCVFVFLGVILEQLYISKNAVDIWGLKLGNKNKSSENNTMPLVGSRVPREKKVIVAY